jgi:hypothetical protein
MAAPAAARSPGWLDDGIGMVGEFSVAPLAHARANEPLGKGMGGSLAGCTLVSRVSRR